MPADTAPLESDDRFAPDPIVALAVLVLSVLALASMADIWALPFLIGSAFWSLEHFKAFGRWCDEQDAIDAMEGN